MELEVVVVIFERPCIVLEKEDRALVADGTPVQVAGPQLPKIPPVGNSSICSPILGPSYVGP